MFPSELIRENRYPENGLVGTKRKWLRMTKIVPWQDPQTDPSLTGKIAKGVAQPRIRTWLRDWWPALAWAVFISVMSTDSFSSEHTKWVFEPVIRWLAPGLSGAQVDLIHHYIRKCAHFTEYFVFGALLYRSVRGTRTGWRWIWGAAALLIAAGYSALDEIHQIFVPSREPRVTDSLIDTAGALFAVLVLWLWMRHRNANSPD
jgi:VanZ family protein